ncbi:MAG: 30S ribosomal protein S20 [Clostridiales bacterium]|nr:30S ribosomal protein S20 [Clostridiales bacterium]
MANIKSAKKRIKVSAKKTALNKVVKSKLKAAVKSFELAINNNKLDDAKKQLKLVEKKLKKAASKGVIHKSRASRKVSRLAKRLLKAQ